MTDSSDVPAPSRSEETVANYLGSLRTAAWKTSGARYNGSRRLARREFFGVVSMALFSVGTVGIAFVQRVYTTSGSQLDNYLTTISAVLGVLLLAVSLTEWGARNGAKSDGLHRNAEALNAFQRKVELRMMCLTASEAQDWDVADGLREEYERIKAECASNHLPIDYLLMAAERRLEKEFLRSGNQPMCWIEAFFIWMRWTWSSLWYFLSLWLIFFAVIAGTWLIANAPK